MWETQCHVGLAFWDGWIWLDPQKNADVGDGKHGMGFAIHCTLACDPLIKMAMGKSRPSQEFLSQLAGL